MGCDIHMYVQYKEKDYDYWQGFGGNLSPGRNYTMFSVLANVRNFGDNENYFQPKGIPEHKLSYECERDLHLYVDDEGKEEGYVKLKMALKWNKDFGCKIINDNEGKPWKVRQPDWHSHSWMTIDELSKAYRIYNIETKKEYGNSKIPCEYRAILDLMRSLGKCGNEVKVVFWFDN